MPNDGLDEFIQKVGKDFVTKEKEETSRPRKRIPENLITKDPEPESESEDSQNKMERGLQGGVWMSFDNKILFQAAEGSVEELPEDTYIIKEVRGRILFRRLFINTDAIFEMPDTNSKKILDHIEKFWQRENIFRKFNFLWKRGILLFGPQGAGKTCLLNLVAKEAIKIGFIVIYVDNPEIAVEGLRLFREVEPHRSLVVILEDIDSIIQNFGEAEMLRLLDGENQVDNVVFIATTNYPENLNPRLINRPSRFDIVMKIDLPSEAARRFYLQKVNPKFHQIDSEILKAELDKWVNDTKGFSVAHLKDLVVSVEIMGASYQDSITRLGKMGYRVHSNDIAGSIGFTKQDENLRDLSLNDN